MELVLWLLSAGALVLVLLTLGLAVAALVHRPGMSPGEDLLVTLGGGIGVTAVAAAVQLLEPLPYTVVSPPLMVVMLCASAVILWKRRAWLRTLVGDQQVVLMASAFAALFTVVVALGALPWDKPSTGGAGTIGSFRAPNMPGDTLLQYRTAEILQNRMNIQTTDYYVNYWFISDRTPLVGLTTMFIESAAGIRLPQSLDPLNEPFLLIDPYGYWLFRLISIFANALIVVSAVLVAWELLGERAARLGAVFIVLSPYVLINVVFHWPKPLAGFFVVGFYFWSHIRRRPVMAGVFAGAAVLSHPLAALFLPGMFVYVFLTKRWRQLLTAGGVAAAALFPWYFWTSAIYHHASRMLTYPLGFTLVDPTNPGPEIRADLVSFLHRPLGSILSDRWIDLWNTFTTWPFPVIAFETKDFHTLAPFVYEVFRTTFPGMFGIGLATFGYLSWKRIATMPFWAATLGGSLVCIVLYWGYQPPTAIGQDVFQPMAGLWICLAAGVLSAWRRSLIRLAVLVNGVEWVVFTFLLLVKPPPLASWHAYGVLMVIVVAVVICAVSVIGWKAAGPPGGKPIGPMPQLVPELTPAEVSLTR